MAEQSKPLEEQPTETLVAILKRLETWARKRGHSPRCWGNEDPKQCVCGLTAALESLPE